VRDHLAATVQLPLQGTVYIKEELFRFAIRRQLLNQVKKKTRLFEKTSRKRHHNVQGNY
jgi:hypothetical protein